MDMQNLKRRLPIGAEVFADGVHFRVWAPSANFVEVQLERSNISFPLVKEEKGYFSGFSHDARTGDHYTFRLDKKAMLYPDPASRYQPEGPHGPSEIVDPSSYTWSDQDWKGVAFEGRIIYEMHIGTFTSQGTWVNAQRELLELADLGINIVEMMPVHEFPGQFGWGYDSVNLFAPTRLYGSPHELRDFIDHAHALGIAVILDVVYNHLGPDGNYLHPFSPDYFTHRYTTEWGDAINFDGPNCEAVREYFIANAGYWIDEYHFDGLRIDATQNIYDQSTPHILQKMAQQVRKMAPHRHTYIVAENESQCARIVYPIEEKGYGLDALWNDDFHHSALVRLTGHNECYYTDYLGSCQEFISIIKYGYLYQGQWYLWHNKKRGTSSLNLNPTAFINFIQNHDQIANSAHGLRIHQLADPGNYRAMTTLLLLAPGTPMLFQGQEFAASSPFYYFADHAPELGELVFKGRRDYFKQFPSISSPAMQALLPSPFNPETFLKSKLNFLDRQLHTKEYALHRDLINLRHNDSVFNSPRLGGVDGAVLHADTFILRFFGDGADTRLLIINFGVDFFLSPCPEPLLAPPEDMEWGILWSSEDSRYGGGGTPPLFTNNQWRISGHAAVVLIAQKSMVE